ncbi:hypothetical protein FVE85_4035 [Porphyridium purpureum]|uniref:Uncharacterized protein n=1 Tax=Porphyridium purpureum TaxID=35688 RepID=A0A5J4YT23_PORPP|nr:hypothetical protein FVE85_4035 [Porphyridium purpureum]|eukprot:POR7270..scf229_5
MEPRRGAGVAVGTATAKVERHVDAPSSAERSTMKGGSTRVSSFQGDFKEQVRRRKDMIVFSFRSLQAQSPREHREKESKATVSRPAQTTTSPDFEFECSRPALRSSASNGSLFHRQDSESVWRHQRPTAFENEVDSYMSGGRCIRRETGSLNRTVTTNLFEAYFYGTLVAPYLMNYNSVFTDQKRCELVDFDELVSLQKFLWMILHGCAPLLVMLTFAVHHGVYAQLGKRFGKQRLCGPKNLPWRIPFVDHSCGCLRQACMLSFIYEIAKRGARILRRLLHVGDAALRLPVHSVCASPAAAMWRKAS